MTTSPVEVDIQMKDSHLLPQTMGRNYETNQPEVQYLFTQTDLIAGTCTIRMRQAKPMEHQGIKIELVGCIEMTNDKAGGYEFTSLTRELEGTGWMAETKSYPFEFANVDKSYETYAGVNCRLRYFLRVKIARPVWPVQQIKDFQVQNIATEPELNNSIKMEVGIEDWSVEICINQPIHQSINHLNKQSETTFNSLRINQSHDVFQTCHYKYHQIFDQSINQHSHQFSW